MSSSALPKVNTRSFGAGPRKALGIHCTLAHAGAMKGLGIALGDAASMLACDLPGHGMSGDWDGQGDLHDVATAMARSVLTEPMHLVGHSFGATVAMRLAVEAPELVLSATLYEPVYFAAAFAEDPSLEAAYRAGNSAFDRAYASGDMMEAARAFNGGWGDGSTWARLPESLRQYMADRIWFVPASQPFLFEDNAGLLAGNRFGETQVPVLLMRGAQSDATTKVINTALAARFGNAKAVELAGAGHMGPVTHPVETAREIKAFWQSLEV